MRRHSTRPDLTHADCQCSVSVWGYDRSTVPGSPDARVPSTERRRYRSTDTDQRRRSRRVSPSDNHGPGGRRAEPAYSYDRLYLFARQEGWRVARFRQIEAVNQISPERSYLHAMVGPVAPSQSGAGARRREVGRDRRRHQHRRCRPRRFTHLFTGDAARGIPLAPGPRASRMAPVQGRTSVLRAHRLRGGLRRVPRQRHVVVGGGGGVTSTCPVPTTPPTRGA